ncbi:hypothetical protein EPUS_07023 [Endocarpon pusillum Z07020]|uniref:Uncharacterized protein n=1 Tax=Endocarpon pusillum (strain Z07020 / HMAS-L-300199) TaxID=1263415 RepID=U1FXZ0_ENDPU|nr:uncharacterized protein EPUS_07023 [Endocarpon pusillum Z07020]ERF69767.1 hypothetical protein EPUS_07023 [Endocarpon pusillum Z07020]
MSLIDPRVKEGFDRGSTTNASDEKRGCRFDFRYGMDSKNRGAGQWFHSVHAAGTGQNSVHRAHFLDELVKLIPKENVSFGEKVDEVEQTEDEVKITFQDGSIATASAIVGSMERAVSLLGHELAQNSQMYCGYGGHVLTFPIEKGKTMNVVASQSKPDGKWEDERWVLPMENGAMEADFEHWGGSVKNILSLMRSQTCGHFLTISRLGHTARVGSAF